ncbi:MAG TPA: ribokinase [Burkholderiaceae bacterium]|nr:ribokinase [Burkholderiaceae bacterium]
MASPPKIFISGIYAADLVFTGQRLPQPGETVTASGFMRSHGGKGSNQAIAAARAGAAVSLFGRVGNDAFGREALALWELEGIKANVSVIDSLPTGAASIFVDTHTGSNTIAVYPGASNSLQGKDVDAVEHDIAASDVFVVQLEQPAQVVVRGLELARRHGVTTILNPAPVVDLPDAVFGLCDYIVPNETEAGSLIGMPVETRADAESAARVLLDKGARHVIITLGEKGALYCGHGDTFLVEARVVGPCVDPTGAGDGFIGGFAVGLARGMETRRAMEFGAALAGISVTRAGAAQAMPTLEEIRAIVGP